MKKLTAISLSVMLVSLLTACSGSKQAGEKQMEIDSRSLLQPPSVEMQTLTVYPAADITYHQNIHHRPGKNMETSGAISTADRALNMKASATAPPEWSRESYNSVDGNGFVNCVNDSLSTFSIDVDTASYANVRRIVNQGALPPVGAVRIEEMINFSLTIIHNLNEINLLLLQLKLAQVLLIQSLAF